MFAYKINKQDSDLRNILPELISSSNWVRANGFIRGVEVGVRGFVAWRRSLHFLRYQDVDFDLGTIVGIAGSRV